MAIFFTSDLHMRHNNILTFEDRPYETVEEMNEDLIEKWNNKVKQGDTVYNIGDFCFGGYNEWVKILDRLNGNKIHIKGNHDKESTLKKLHKNGYLKEVYMVGHYMKIQKNILHLTHYPMDIGMRPRMFSIHGHIHNYNSKEINQINVCIDSPLQFNRNFGEPISLEELMRHIDIRNPLIEKAFIGNRTI